MQLFLKHSLLGAAGLLRSGCQGGASLLLEVDHQVPEGLVVGGRQQHQHFMDRFQPLIGTGDFWEDHTTGISARPRGINFYREARG